MTFPATHPALARALLARGYCVPTAVQVAVLQGDAATRDLLVSAQTGSGKTVAFGLALATTLLGADERFAPAAEPLALIIAPTRELAMQVQRELAWLYADTGARVATCVGGMDVRAETQQLRSGAHIVVGTPGRLRDHLERKRLDLTKLKSIVLDEADEMLDLGFREDLEVILDATPATRQTLLFSATLPREIETLAGRYQRDAIRIATVRRDEQHADIDYHAIRVAPHEIENAVVNVLRLHESRATLVFCATREAVKRLHARLVERGFSAVALSGELTQGERTHALQALRDGRARVLVATDVAARGLDLPDLALVIHADLPNDRETLLHRSGRTGRAGRKGLCTLIVPYNRRRKAEALLAAAKLNVTWAPAPTADEIRARDQERLLADAIFMETPTEEDLVLARAIQVTRTADEIAIALARINRLRFPAPEDLAQDRGPWRREDAPSPRREGFGTQDGHMHLPDGPARRPAARGGRPAHSAREDSREMVWFRLNVGRERNADPRWLLPLICRAGNVSKSEVGAIKIFDRDTRFQIVAEFAEQFAESALKNRPKGEHISRVDAHAPADAATAKAIEPPQGTAATVEKTTAPARTQLNARSESPWRDRGKPKAGPRPHRKGTSYQKRSPHSQGAQHAAGSGASRLPSKYAHKKKNRAGGPAKT